MRYVAAILFSCVMTSPAHCASAQDQYDESVGYAFGYSMMASKMGEKCQALYPEYAASIEEGLRKWRERNAQALQEISVQWQAYVERDHKEANLSKEAYTRSIEEYAELGTKQAFDKLHGERSVFARQHCQEYASATLKSTKLYLEAKLSQELASFRSCHESNLCPNVVTTEK